MIACPQGIVFFLIIRPDQEKAIKKILSVLRALAVQKIVLGWFNYKNQRITFVNFYVWMHF